MIFKKFQKLCPDSNDSLYIFVNGTASGPLASLMSLLGMLKDALLSFSQENRVNTWAWVTGAR